MLNDVKTAIGVSAATTGTGVSTWLDYIPDDIGKIATLAGIILSAVLIYSHLKKGRLERQKLHLEIEVLQNAARSEVLQNAARSEVLQNAAKETSLK